VAFDETMRRVAILDFRDHAERGEEIGLTFLTPREHLIEGAGTVAEKVVELVPSVSMPLEALDICIHDDDPRAVHSDGESSDSRGEMCFFEEDIVVVADRVKIDQATVPLVEFAIESNSVGCFIAWEGRFNSVAGAS
jgi:hypothetical protein